jgi:hypothetical protein
MGTTLYILRQQSDHISPSVFRMSDTNIDVIFMEQGTSLTSSSVEEVTIGEVGAMDGGSRRILTYDDLIEKIFSSERVVVV